MRLLIADDHTLFRDALVHYIIRAEPDAHVIVASDLYEVLELMKGNPEPDLILLDLRMPGMEGLEGFKKLQTAYPEIPIAILSGTAEISDIRQAMELGAVGYFPKTLSGKALLKAVQLVLAGEKFMPIDRQSSDIMPAYHGSGGRDSAGSPVLLAGSSGQNQLTPREREVLSYLLAGASNKEIANALRLQVVTVKLHIRGICRKLEAKNRTQAALKARELGIVAAHA